MLRKWAKKMRIAIEGCCHGELDEIYKRIELEDRRVGKVTELLLICGDFQAVRNRTDLNTLACPRKYRRMNSFHDYYTGRKKAYVLTVFIGGNHEASNHLQELFHGGWVAPQIFYMGWAGIVRFQGLRIAGVSGIYNQNTFVNKPIRSEVPPYSESQMRSVYHIRPLQAIQFELLARTGDSPVDVFLSHDWPKGIVKYGNLQELLKRKPFLRSEIENDSFGNPPMEKILHSLKPRYWFSAHMHVRFSATVNHSNSSKLDLGKVAGKNKATKFLALDKCLPRRQYIEFMDIETPCGDGENLAKGLCYDPEWLSILCATHKYIMTDPDKLPPQDELEKELESHRETVEGAFKESQFVIPENLFVKTVPGSHEVAPKSKEMLHQLIGNPQTDFLLDKLNLNHLPPVIVPFSMRKHLKAADLNGRDSLSCEAVFDESEINID